MYVLGTYNFIYFWGHIYSFHLQNIPFIPYISHFPIFLHFYIPNIPFSWDSPRIQPDLLTMRIRSTYFLYFSCFILIFWFPTFWEYSIISVHFRDIYTFHFSKYRKSKYSVFPTYPGFLYPYTLYSLHLLYFKCSVFFIPHKAVP